MCHDYVAAWEHSADDNYSPPSESVWFSRKMIVQIKNDKNTTHNEYHLQDEVEK